MKRTYSVHIYRHRTLGSQNTKNTYDFFVQVGNLLLHFSLKGLRHKERDTHSFYSGFSVCLPPPISCDTCPRPPRASESQPSSPEAGLNSTHWLFQNPPHPQRALPVQDVIHINWSTFLSDFYFDIYERHILPTHALPPALKFAPN